MRCPYSLLALGYVPDPANPLRFVHPHGHPFYPVEFKTETSKHAGDTLHAMLQAAYQAGQRGIPCEVAITTPLVFIECKGEIVGADTGTLTPVSDSHSFAICNTLGGGKPSVANQCSICRNGPCALYK